MAMEELRKRIDRKMEDRQAQERAWAEQREANDRKLQEKVRFHADRREKARTFYDQGEVKETIDRFRETIRDGGSYGGLSEAPFPRRDEDSVVHVVEWDVSEGGGIVWGSGSAKYLVVETCPDGVILVHGGSNKNPQTRIAIGPIVFRQESDGLVGSSMISMEALKNNSELLDEALVRAYDNPLVHTWTREMPMD